jgi:hypothetical protein
MTPFDRGDTTVALAGDWHGNIGWAQKAIPFLRRTGVRTVYHVGDLGFWGEAPGTGFRATLEFWLAQGDINLFCTPGNHENWDALDLLFAADPGQPVRLEEHLWMLPRGHRWAHGGRSFVSLGGAPSVDFEYRIPGKSWWANEALTEADVERTVAGGHTEIMLTHDAPKHGTEAVRRIRVPSDDPPFSWGPAALAYADEGTALLDRAFDGVRPDLLVHGHFHAKDSVTLPTGQRIYSLNKDGNAGNLALLDLATLGIEWLDPTAPRA